MGKSSRYWAVAWIVIAALLVARKKLIDQEGEEPTTNTNSHPQHELTSVVDPLPPPPSSSSTTITPKPSVPPSATRTSLARDPKYDGRVANALRAQDKVIATFQGAPQPTNASQIAQAALILPEPCMDDLGFSADRDMDCFREIAAWTAGELSPPHTALCWGYSSRGADEEPLVFHTLVITDEIPSQAPLMLWSFLATQCCDAVLNVWLGPKAFSNSARAAMDIPTHHAHRIVYRLYDGAKEWASVKEDFSAHNQTAVDAMTSMPDLRFHSDWARMIIMYNYGGTWFDLDTVYLRDLRMVTAFQPFLYRAGALILPNNAVFRLGKRPNELSRRIIDSVLTGGHPGPIPVFYNLGMSAMGSATGVKYLAEALFDFSWIRFAESECAAMKEVHPELVKQRQGGDNWDAFFTRHARDDAELDAWRSSSFMPGSLTYHWHMSFSDHNRHLEGLPPRSWAGVLLQRYQALALEKTICAPVPAP